MACTENIDDLLVSITLSLLVPVRSKLCDYIINLPRDTLIYIIDKYYFETSSKINSTSGGLTDTTINEVLPSIISLFIEITDVEVCQYIMSKIILTDYDINDLIDYYYSILRRQENYSINDDSNWKLKLIKQRINREYPSYKFIDIHV